MTEILPDGEEDGRMNECTQPGDELESRLCIENGYDLNKSESSVFLRETCASGTQFLNFNENTTGTIEIHIHGK